MKFLVVTRSDENIGYYSKETHNILKLYADKCKADFKILDKDPVVWTEEKPPRPHFRIMELYNLHEEYDRILCIDSDVIINKGCPNIFDEVPDDRIGTVTYDNIPGSVEERKLERIMIQKAWGEIGWNDQNVNTGVFVTSKMHRNIFTPFKGQYWTALGTDDIHIGYLIKYYGFKIHRLSFEWNHMSIFSQPWNKSASKFDSYIIHYAGGWAAKIPIPNDIEKIYGTKMPEAI